MKNFLSEYGFAILAAIVVILLIAMCTPVDNLIKNQIMGVVDSFATKTESKLYSMDAGNETAVIIKQLDDAGKFSITATTNSETDVLKASYRVKDQHGNWGEWKILGNLGTGSKEHTGEFVAKIENGNEIQVRVVDEGKENNLFCESNIVEYTGESSEEGLFQTTSGNTLLSIEEIDFSVSWTFEGHIANENLLLSQAVEGSDLKIKAYYNTVDAKDGNETYKILSLDDYYLWFDWVKGNYYNITVFDANGIYEGEHSMDGWCIISGSPAID